jgi:hypothetical protein
VVSDQLRRAVLVDLLRRLSSIFCLAILISSALPGQAGKSDCLSCDTVNRKAAPKYRVGQKRPDTAGGLTVNISIRKDQFTRVALSALACRLRHDFQNNDLFVQIFDDVKSAKYYVAPWYQELPPHWKDRERSWRASYARDDVKREHWLIWYTDPEKTREERIDLCPPAQGTDSVSKSCRQ